jgi:hypothetical protein
MGLSFRPTGVPEGKSPASPQRLLPEPASGEIDRQSHDVAADHRAVFADAGRLVDLTFSFNVVAM